MRKSFMDKPRYLCFSLMVLAALLCISAAGCVKLDRPNLDRKYFTIDVNRSSTNAHEPSPQNLIVRRVKVSPRYEDRDLVYKTAESIFEADYYNAFFIPPAAMITQELRLWMGESGLFANVLGPESMGTGELLLEGVVNSIYGDYTGESPKAVINMQFYLLDNSSPDMPIIYSRNFKKEILTKSTGPDGLVRAMNKGLAEIFSELETDMVTVLAKK